MKKLLLLLSVALATLFIYAFVANSGDVQEYKITVTADQAKTFDMFHNSIVAKGLKTPYELVLKTTDEQFIFKSRNPETLLKVKVEVEKPNKRTVTGEWPVVVLLVDKDKITTFGMD
jgi:hypothetical protein